MTLLLLEALGALVLLVLIVWWTMFSGRQNGELPPAPEVPEAGDKGAFTQPQPPAADTNGPH